MRAVLTIIAILATGAAHGACFEDLGETGCTDEETFPIRDLRHLSCENLWLVRNTIYDENGLCFRTARAQDYFDNSDCYIDDPGAVSLNTYERGNVNRIVQVESELGCR
jgi:hypothetical protein